MNGPNPQRAVVLFGHGSRDPLWRGPMDAVAERLRALPDAPSPVLCAFLELDTPSLPEAVERCLALGARSVTVLPMFLGVGRHARHDLPALVAELRAAHPDLHLEVRPSIGEDPQVLDLLARLAAG